MKISAEAKTFLRDALYDDECFVRVGQITVGGACCAKLILGVTIDEEFDEDEDIRQEIDGLPVVISRQLNDTLKDISLDFVPDKGVVVNHS